MAQTIRITITPDLDKALKILRRSVSATLKTSELIRLAVGGFAKIKSADVSEEDISSEEWDLMSAKQFYNWAKEDGSLDVDNIAHPEKLKPFSP